MRATSNAHEGDLNEETVSKLAPDKLLDHRRRSLGSSRHHAKGSGGATGG
jgi:hypothetical protein